MTAYIEYFSAGGYLMLPLVLTAFLIWYLYLSLLLRLKSLLRTPDVCGLGLSEESLRRRIGQTIPGRPATGVSGVVPRLIDGCLARMRAGLSFREAFLQTQSNETSIFSYSFYILGALVVSAPLMGLLGTVLGMISTFTAVAARSAETAETVAGGVSQALITTQVGLIAALPGTFGLAHLHRLYQRLKNTIARCESHLALIFEHAPANGGQVPRRAER
jgi:biopolymer transport protein ExbB